MAKADTAKQIDTLLGITTDPEKYTQQQLDTLLAAAKQNREAYDKALSEIQPAQDSQQQSTPKEAPVAESTEGKIKVVTGEKATGSFMHPETKQSIRRGETKPVPVPYDAWTQEMIGRKFLKEVRK
jgi:hypothetical protein